MFEGDLATPVRTAEHAGVGRRATHAEAKPDRRAAARARPGLRRTGSFHPSVCPTRPGRRSCDGREARGGAGAVRGARRSPTFAVVAEFAVVVGISPRGCGGLSGAGGLALRPTGFFRSPWGPGVPGRGRRRRGKARQLAAACVRLPEGRRPARVDRRVRATRWTRSPPYRLDKIIAAAKMHADPAGARAEGRGEGPANAACSSVVPTCYGNKSTYIKAPAGAVIRHDATIRRPSADAPENLRRPPARSQHRRADAVGIIRRRPATPEETPHPSPATHHRHTTPAHLRGRPPPLADNDRLGHHRHLRQHHSGTRPARAPPTSGLPGAARPGEPIYPAGPAAPRRATRLPPTPDTGFRFPGWSDEDLLDHPPSDRASDWTKPGPDDEAGRDATPPQRPGPTPPDNRCRSNPSTHSTRFDPGLRSDADDGPAPGRRPPKHALHARLARITKTRRPTPTHIRVAAVDGCVRGRPRSMSTSPTTR